MYVSYLLDKEVSMYPSSVRHSGLNLGAQNFVSPPQYPDYGTYHVPGVNLDSATQSAASWHSPYGPPREEWSAYAPVPTNGAHSINASAGTLPYCAADYNPVQHSGGGVIHALNTSAAEHQAPSSPRRSYEWIKKTPQPVITGPGKTRTKDKYRVVYTDHQRLELEKEFHYSRYITIRRKAEISVTLGLTERQVKIWFQNRRAKERKLTRKKSQSEPGSVHSGSDGRPSPQPALEPAPLPHHAGIRCPSAAVLSALVPQ